MNVDIDTHCFWCHRPRDVWPRFTDSTINRPSGVRVPAIPVMQAGSVPKSTKQRARGPGRQKSKITEADVVSEDTLSDVTDSGSVKLESKWSETNSAGTSKSRVTHDGHRILVDTVKNDPELAPVYTQAFQCMTAKVFESHFLQLLTSFYRDLYRDAQTVHEKNVAQFFRIYGKVLAQIITITYTDVTDTQYTEYRDMEQKRLEEQIRSRNDDNPALGSDNIEVRNDEFDDMGILSEDDKMDLVSYPYPMQIADTLKSGLPFKTFKNDLRKLVEFKSAEVLALRVDHGTQRVTRRQTRGGNTWNTFSTGVQLGVSRLKSLSSSSFQRLIMALTRPPVRRGQQRITWICVSSLFMYCAAIQNAEEVTGLWSLHVYRCPRNL